jgi:glycosyltransferase involved in cell wall biosynthesis
MQETLQKLPAPKVTVIIPAYCAAGYIKTALDSVFAQSFADYELIVVNDGSPDTDELEGALKPYRGKYIYIRQQNKGPGAARNAGIKIARGEFLAFLDSDDYWMPHYLAEQLRVFETDRSVDMVYADAILTENPLLAGKTFMSLTPSAGRADFEGLLTARCTVILSGTVARRQPIVEAGLFDERLSHSEDFDLWLKLATAGANIAYQKKSLLFRRELSTSLCGDPSALFRCQLRVLARLARQGGLSPEREKLIKGRIETTKASIKLELAKRSLARGDFLKASEAIKAAYHVFRGRKLWLGMLLLRVCPRSLLRLHDYRRRRLPAPKEVSTKASGE